MSASLPPLLFVGPGFPNQESDRAAVEGALERVYALPEFQDEESLLEDFLEAFDFDVGGAAGNALAYAFLAFVVVLVIVALFFGCRAWFRHRRRRHAMDAEPGVDVAARVSELRRQAAAARAAGDLRLALRLSFFALVVGLGRTGDLEYRDAWTYRELLARGRPKGDVATLLGALVSELEAKEFGNEPTLVEDVDRVEALCRDRLGSLGAAA